MLSQKVRQKFLTYFKEKEHVIVPSSPTVPHDDPSLLFTNAGMNQFKDVFLGKSKRDYQRATSSQKCIRVGGKHNDLDNVGHTSRHMTFFEMLGNFSFGDYFKKEAIDFAWEVTTEVFHYEPERIWVSVFETDDEAYELWKAHIDEKRILRLGEDENFWSMGSTGPCGPCSELLYDRGEKFGKALHPLEDKTGERYPEFWNLVFMEFNRDSNGKMTPLPKKSVDTGAGLERVVSFKTGAENVFQTDILRSLMTQTERLSGKKYDPKNGALAPAFHVIADHLRALAFAIADGAQPSNTERGYVLRKILRRATRYGRLLGLNKPFLAELLPTLITAMGSDYHELKQSKDQISEILTLEEESFLRTLRRGGNILNAITQEASKRSHKEISGEEAFKLKDTYGFPLEEILLIAKDSGLTVNLDAYKILEEKARALSRQAQASHKEEVETSTFEHFIKSHGTCSFVGYDKEVTEASIIGLIVNGELVETMEGGQKGLILLDETPFYPEKGGQVGDTGTLSHAQALFEVEDCKTPYPGIIAHYGTLKEGTFIVGEPVLAQINHKRRAAIAKHHTATHLLHWALQEVLGPHIKQGGSLVEPSRLRFDFNHHKALSKEEIRDIESLVNKKIWENQPVETYEINYQEVQKHPEIKQFFGDKYGEIVRVVAISNYSKELCGGTHVQNVGSIGYFRIAKEGSIAKGVRRIEGVIGKAGELLRYAVEDTLSHLASMMKSDPSKIEETLHALLKENSELKEKALLARKKQLNALASSLIPNVKTIKNIPLLTAVVEVAKGELHALGTIIIEQVGSAILLLGIIEQHTCQLYLKISPDLVQKGFHANALIKELAPLIEGAGGGKKEVAQAGGKKAGGVMIAMSTITQILQA